MKNKIDLKKAITNMLADPDFDNKIHQRDIFKDFYYCKCGIEFTDFHLYLEHVHKLRLKFWKHGKKSWVSTIAGYKIYES